MHKFIVKNGILATEYCITDRFYKADPDEMAKPTHGNGSVLMSPYTETFFHECFDHINYPNHLWDLVERLGEFILPSKVPDWFNRHDVTKRLAHLAHEGHIKIWLIKNQRVRMIAPETVEVAGNGGGGGGSSSSKGQPGLNEQIAAYRKKREKEKAEIGKVGEMPKPVAPSLKKKKASKMLPELPQSLEEVEARIAEATKKLEYARKNKLPLPSSPYSTEDKLAIVEKGLEERFIVRVIRTEYANDAGSIGRSNSEGKATYWTTTYTQLEYADSDAKLIAKAVGTGYDPNSEYTLLVIDTQKAAEVGDMETFIPTYENMRKFAKQELVNNPEVELAYIDQVLTPEYSKQYAAYTQQAKDDGLDLLNEKNFEEFTQTQGLSAEEKRQLKTRVAIHNELGANEMFLGNGLTMDANAPKGELAYGTVETYSYDKKPMKLGYLEKEKVLKRHTLNSPA